MGDYIVSAQGVKADEERVKIKVKILYFLWLTSFLSCHILLIVIKMMMPATYYYFFFSEIVICTELLKKLQVIVVLVSYSY